MAKVKEGQGGSTAAAGSAATKPTERKRTPSEFCVLAVRADKSLTVVKAGLESSQDSLAFIRTNGKTGETYQIAQFKGGAIQVQIEEVRKAHLLNI